jgi:hypothetical protein
MDGPLGIKAHGWGAWCMKFTMGVGNVLFRRPARGPTADLSSEASCSVGMIGETDPDALSKVLIRGPRVPRKVERAAIYARVSTDAQNGLDDRVKVLFAAADESRLWPEAEMTPIDPGGGLLVYCGHDSAANRVPCPPGSAIEATSSMPVAKVGVAD